MDTVVAESRVTLDPGFLCQDVIVLSLQVAYDLTEAKPCQKIVQIYMECAVCTWLRYQLNRRNRECRQWSERYGFLPRPALRECISIRKSAVASPILSSPPENAYRL